MSHPLWEADKMLDVYILDYLMKRKLHASARAFQLEGNVSADPVVIDAPSGFLLEWWSVFWDIFIAKTAWKDQNHSEAALSYIETLQTKTREMQKQQVHQKPNQHQQMQMQQLLQRHAQQQLQPQQQQCKGGTQVVRDSTTGPVGNNPLMRQNHMIVNAMATKTHEERLKFPLQGEALDNAPARQRIGGAAGQLVRPIKASLLKATAAATTATVGRPAGETLHGAPRGLPGNLPHVQSCNQQLAGLNQGSSSLTLKGWPLAGLDQLCSGFLPQNALMQSPESFNQLSLQQQLMLQAQQNLVDTSVNNLDSWKVKMLLNNQNMGPEKDGILNPVGDLVPSIATSVHDLPDSNSNTSFKQQVQQSCQQVQQYSHYILSSQQSQNLEQQDKMVGTGSIPSMFQGNDQASKSHSGRKRKQASSSGPANSSGTANTTGPSSTSPATPSTQTVDVMSVSSLQQNVPLSKSPLMFGSDGLGSFTSAQNQMEDMDRLLADGSLGDNAESFLSPDDADPRSGSGKGFSFKEINHIMASTQQIECCHFSSDGKLLATAGRDKKASLWCTNSLDLKLTLEEHTEWITDVRFSPSMSHIATSSADKTVRVWDVDNPVCSLRTFTGHSTTVKSLDFHPCKEDLIFSCDNHNEIRYWSIKNGGCAGVIKIGATQMRFQPSGTLLSAAADNYISVIDIEHPFQRFKLEGHKNPVRSLCWDFSGEYLASVSNNLVRVWTVKSGKGECIQELNASGKQFNTCVFHPSYPLLIIGCNETLELWNLSENKTMSIHAHDNLVCSLAASNATGLVVSASLDKHVKIWK
ncbi:hypothetical protein QN277_026233 [Acacia crassicarpa]|uniref:Transcriptional corepressor LEUNIG n=1 Tax=Acacia crassicarpa TaxID=499986 RepID=A0AAE1K6C0_9FABA|nr:hypothetical protein QN277_026233 [Acacia crassicarpa]